MRTIAVLTGTRADYGLLRGLLREIEAHAELELQLIVTGTHLSEAFGRTASEIERDGLAVAASVPPRGSTCPTRVIAGSCSTS